MRLSKVIALQNRDTPASAYNLLVLLQQSVGDARAAIKEVFSPPPQELLPAITKRQTELETLLNHFATITTPQRKALYLEKLRETGTRLTELLTTLTDIIGRKSAPDQQDNRLNDILHLNTLKEIMTYQCTQLSQPERIVMAKTETAFHEGARLGYHLQLLKAALENPPEKLLGDMLKTLHDRLSMDLERVLAAKSLPQAVALADGMHVLVDRVLMADLLPAWVKTRQADKKDADKKSVAASWFEECKTHVQAIQTYLTGLRGKLSYDMTRRQLDMMGNYFSNTTRLTGPLALLDAYFYTPSGGTFSTSFLCKAELKLVLGKAEMKEEESERCFSQLLPLLQPESMGVSRFFTRTETGVTVPAAFLLQAAQYLCRTHGFESALLILRQAIARKEPSPPGLMAECHLLLVTASLQLRKTTSCEAWLQTALDLLKQEKDTPQVTRLCATAYLLQGRLHLSSAAFCKAKESFNRAYTLWRTVYEKEDGIDLAELWAGEAVAECLQGNYAQAENALRKFHYVLSLNRDALPPTDRDRYYSIFTLMPSLTGSANRTLRRELDEIVRLLTGLPKPDPKAWHPFEECLQAFREELPMESIKRLEKGIGDVLAQLKTALKTPSYIWQARRMLEWLEVVLAEYETYQTKSSQTNLQPVLNQIWSGVYPDSPALFPLCIEGELTRVTTLFIDNSPEKTETAAAVLRLAASRGSVTMFTLLLKKTGLTAAQVLYTKAPSADMSPVELAAVSGKTAFVYQFFKDEVSAKDHSSANGKPSAEVYMMLVKHLLNHYMLKTADPEVRSHQVELITYLLEKTVSPEKSPNPSEKSSETPEKVRKVWEMIGWNELHLAAWNGATGMTISVDMLRSTGAFNGTTPLHLACLRGHTDTVKVLCNALTDKTGLNQTDRYKFTALHYAAFHRCSGIILYLLQQGCDPNATDLQGRSPIFFVAGEDPAGRPADAELIRLFIQYGATPGIRDRRGRTIFHWLILQPDVDAFKPVMSQLTSSKAYLAESYPILHLCAQYGKIRHFIDLVTLFPQLVFNEDIHQRTLLHEAARSGCEDILRFGLNCGLDGNRKDSLSVTALIYASRNNHAACATIILEHTSLPDVNARDPEGRPALFWASWHRQPGLIRDLIARGAVVNQTDDHLLRPLHLACFTGEAEGLMALLDHYAEKTIGDGLAQLPVHWLIRRAETAAFETGRETAPPSKDSADIPLFDPEGQSARLLKDWAAHFNRQDALGRTVLHLAVTTGIPELVAWLLQQGAPVKTRDHDGRTPFLLAVCLGVLALIRPFLGHLTKEDLETVDRHDNNALHYAANAGNPKLAWFLLTDSSCGHLMAGLLHRPNKDGKLPMDLLKEKSNHPFTMQVLAQLTCYHALLHSSPKQPATVDERQWRLIIKQDKAGLKKEFYSEHRQRMLEKVMLLGKDYFQEIYTDAFYETTAHDFIKLPAPGDQIKEFTEADLFWSPVAEKPLGSPVHWAVLLGQKATLQQLMQSEMGALATARDPLGRTCIMLAAGAGEADIMTFLINAIPAPDRESMINFRDYEGKTALEWAVHYGHFDCVLRLVANGARLNTRDKTGNSPLFSALAGRKTLIALYLIREGADIRDTDRNGNTPLHLAIENELITVVTALLGANADPARENLKGKTPFALLRESRQPLFRFLFATLCDDFYFNPRPARQPAASPLLSLASGAYGFKPLHEAAYSGETEKVATLLKEGADPDTLTDTGYSAAHLAAWNGRLAVLRMLHEKKASLHTGDLSARTPLFWASWSGFTTVVAWLLEVTPDSLEKADSKGFTPLHAAALNGHAETVQLLVKTAISRTKEALLQLGDGQTQRSPLQWAVFNGHRDVVIILLDAGVSAELPDNRGNACLHEAVYNPLMLDTLASKAPALNWNIRNQLRETPLHRAMREGQAPAIHWLLLKGADLFAADQEGRTPVDLLLANAPLLDRVKTHSLFILTRNVLREQVYQCIKNGNWAQLEKLDQLDIGLTDFRFEHGQTVLHVAARHARANILLQLLIQCHCVSIIDVKDEFGKTARELTDNSVIQATLDYYNPQSGKIRQWISYFFIKSTDK